MLRPSPPFHRTLAATLALAVLALPGRGADATTEADRTALLTAIAQAPGVVAASLRVTAAERARGGADVLPDPMVGIDAGRERMRTGRSMGMYGAMIEQPIPRWGEREAQRLGARARQSMSEADRAMVVAEHAVAVVAALAEIHAVDRQRALVEESRQRVRALQAVVRARLAVGGALVGDQLALDTRDQQLGLQLDDLARRRADADAEVRGRLGLETEASLPPAAWPDPASIRVEDGPQTLRARADGDEARAMERETAARAHPETAVGLVWEREAAGEEEQLDKFSLSFRVSLPIWRGAYADAAAAARGRARAASHDVVAAERMARSQVAQARRAAEQADRAQAVADAVAERARTEYDAVIRQVGTGAASITTALDLLDRITEARMQAIEARLMSRTALAGLWRIAPPVLPAVPEPSTSRPDGHP